MTASDCLIRGLQFGGARRLFIRVVYGLRASRGSLGMIAAGEAESVGRDVTSFKEGDQLFGVGGFRVWHLRREGVLAD